jgi:hypothetical protein
LKKRLQRTLWRQLMTRRSGRTDLGLPRNRSFSIKRSRRP